MPRNTVCPIRYNTLDPATPAVVIDQQIGMQKIMEHLFDLGHREVAEISGPFNHVDARIRHAVYNGNDDSKEFLFRIHGSRVISQ